MITQKRTLVSKIWFLLEELRTKWRELPPLHQGSVARMVEVIGATTKAKGTLSRGLLEIWLQELIYYKTQAEIKYYEKQFIRELEKVRAKQGRTDGGKEG